MIVRILNEGQWTLDDEAFAALNAHDEEIESAVESGDETRLTSALTALLDEVRRVGTVVPDDSLADSDLILPDAEATLAEVREWLADNTSGEGLIPG
ncbi:hypothetical protein GC722_15280 [Auraticoccus sp. F435]|uniref:PspA-associated domain-containing protein n=1 Tax=Auraticoccus cholistanensis TaxID=2656650 RepID=A0A6A9UWZ5_9ACTN|nr:hypothetical protein [Auraticoccus cholistanensis]MVA77373.1 hypothetical protein [Auraticoccus cholistanensis]